jgi:threonine dehydrogenase-like Zn-dependent dehydrogenase
MLGAGRVIAIDKVPERLAMARDHGKAETLDFSTSDIYDALMDMTEGRGPDSCIDCVGTEANAGGSFDSMIDKVKASVYLGTDRPHVLRETIYCCRKGGTISVPGVYIGLVDHIPFGAAMNKGLTFRMGQTHTQRYLEPLLQKVQGGDIDPSFVITHRAGLEAGPDLYRKFRDKQDGCVKVVMRPHG